jgi:hypothetical protein
MLPKARGSAPLAKSNSTELTLPYCDALCSGVSFFNVVVVFTFAPSVKRSETSSSSPRFAASIRRFSGVCRNENMLREGDCCEGELPEVSLLPVGAGDRGERGSWGDDAEAAAAYGT